MTFPLTDDDVALEDVERFLVDLSVETPGSGVTVVQPERTQINVLDDDGELKTINIIVAVIKATKDPHMNCKSAWTEMHRLGHQPSCSLSSI